MRNFVVIKLRIHGCLHQNPGPMAYLALACELVTEVALEYQKLFSTSVAVRLKAATRRKGDQRRAACHLNRASDFIPNHFAG